jgi:hypothetical protein
MQGYLAFQAADDNAADLLHSSYWRGVLTVNASAETMPNLIISSYENRAHQE